MESLFIQLSDNVPYDWFCGPGSHIRWLDFLCKSLQNTDRNTTRGFVFVSASEVKMETHLEKTAFKDALLFKSTGTNR